MKNVFLLILLYLISLYGFAQTVTHGMLTPDNGLSSGSVSCLYKDNIGYLYIGTYKGIDRFNGSFVESIPFPGIENGKLSWVRDIIDLGQDNLLVGNVHGLWLMDKHTLKYKRIAQKTIDCGVTSFASAADGYVYIGTVRGLYRIDSDGHVESLDISNSQISDYAVTSVRVQKNKTSNVWVSLKHGVLKYIPGGKSKYYTYKKNPAIQIKKLAISPDGQVFAGTSRYGVMKLDLQKQALAPWALENKMINDIQSDGNHLLVATELYGCFELDAKTGKTLHTYSSTGSVDNTYVSLHYS